jgi:HAD superfamily hydrolase (TIGR01509 family)
VRRERDDLAHDLSAIRRESLRRMLAASGDDPALAEPAFAVVHEARQRVDLYPEVAAALDRLAARVPLLAVTNGNADLERTGVAHWFRGAVAAADVGVGKPHPRVFEVACRTLGLPPGEVLHAGDDVRLDVDAALGAGLQAAWVQRDQAGDAPPGAARVRDLTDLADLLAAGPPATGDDSGARRRS